jgi:hypothetical protein
MPSVGLDRVLCALAVNARNTDVISASARTLQTSQAPTTVVTMANVVWQIKKGCYIARDIIMYTITEDISAKGTRQPKKIFNNPTVTLHMFFLYVCTCD